MRIVVSGGGTGGHIFPALALCEGLKRKDSGCELLYIGSTVGMEREIVPQAGIPFQGVTARKLRTLIAFSTLGALASFFKGYREARGALRAFKPGAVIGTGGYVAATATLAAASLGIPVTILAPDALPGRTNRMLARFARRICVVFKETVPRFPAGKTLVTGLPLREGIVAPPQIDRAVARCRFNSLRPDRFTLLVIGGSQGARALNDVVVASLRQLAERGVQVLHQTGPKNIQDVIAAARAYGLELGAPYCPVGFLSPDEVPLAYRAADLILCRGGISTLSEVMANGLPALIVPLPTAYADHQTVNAEAVAAAGGAIHFPERDLTAESLVSNVVTLMDSPGRLIAMSEASRSVSHPDASDRVAELVLSL